MVTLGFDNYVEPLTLYLHKYRETTKTDRNINSSDNTFDETTASNDFSELVVLNDVYFYLAIIFRMNFSTFSFIENIGNNMNTNSNANGGSSTANNTSANVVGGGVVLGQIGESILYYQNDQNQQFQL